MISTVVVLAKNPTQAASQNATNGDKQSPGNPQWYEKSATTVGPMENMASKGGHRLTLLAGSAVYMEGNSTLHHYEMNAHALKGSALLKTSPKDLLKALQEGKVGAMVFEVPLIGLKSKDSGLDKSAYKALKAKADPEIKFALTGETLKPGKEAGVFVMIAQGSLTVAGETIPIILTADTRVRGDQVRLQGVQKLRMTDFKIQPPTMSILVLSVTCTDEFEVHYDVTFGPGEG